MQPFPGICSAFWMTMCIIQYGWQLASKRELRLEARTVKWCVPKKHFDPFMHTQMTSPILKNKILIIFILPTLFLLKYGLYSSSHFNSSLQGSFSFHRKTKKHPSRKDWISRGNDVKIPACCRTSDVIVCAEFLCGCEICLCSKIKEDWCASHDLSYLSL